jgi:hypothetical protein
LSRALLIALLLSMTASGCNGGGSSPTEQPVDSATSKVTLEWAPPSTNEDGSALTDLAGYKVYYGQEAYNLDQVLDLRSAAISSAEVQGLERGVWYFAIASYNAAGVESAKSGVVSTQL